MLARIAFLVLGYYKEPELTAAVFTTSEDSAGEGYLKTGDLGVFENRNKKPYLVLKGRNKNMILGSNGENIYPEDIEFVLNQHPFKIFHLKKRCTKRATCRISFAESSRSYIRFSY